MNNNSNMPHNGCNNEKIANNNPQQVSNTNQTTNFTQQGYVANQQISNQPYAEYQQQIPNGIGDTNNMYTSPIFDSNSNEYPKPPVIKRVYDKLDRVFAWLAIATGFLFILTIGSLWFDFGIGATLFFEASLVISYCYAKKRGLKIDALHNVSFILLIILAVSFSIFSNALALGFNFIFISFAIAIWLYSIGEEKNENLLSKVMTSLIIYPFMNYGALYGAAFKKNNPNQKSNAKWVLLGLCIALPLVGIVSALLISSDEMFNAMFSALFEDFLSNIFEYVWYTIVGLPLAMAIFSIWYTKFKENEKIKNSKKDNSYSPNQGNVINNYRIAPPAMMYSIAIPLCVVYFLYLISQVSYFISFIADNLLPDDYTIVDYARRGFFELCAVAAINIILVTLLLFLTKCPQDKMPKGLRAITVFMSSFTLIFVGTAIYKMCMYIDKFGYTPARINTIVFMSFLLILFALIIASQFFKKMKFTAIVTVVAILFMLGYTVIDVDSFVVKQNIKLYEDDEIPWMGMSLIYQLDYSALEHLAEFASDENNSLPTEENFRLELELHNRYKEQKQKYNIDSHKELFSFNFSEYKAHNTLEKYGYDEDFEDILYDKYSNYDFYDDYSYFY